MFLHIDVAPRSSFLVSQALQLAQEAAVTGWVMGSSPQFFGTHGQLGAPAPEPCPWVSSSWTAVTFGVLWERSLFPDSHSGLEGADSKPQEQLTSALSHSPPAPLPAACHVLVVCLQAGALAEPGPGLVVGTTWRSSSHFSLVSLSIRGL